MLAQEMYSIPKARDSTFIVHSSDTAHDFLSNTDTDLSNTDSLELNNRNSKSTTNDHSCNNCGQLRFYRKMVRDIFAFSCQIQNSNTYSQLVHDIVKQILYFINMTDSLSFYILSKSLSSAALNADIVMNNFNLYTPNEAYYSRFNYMPIDLKQLPNLSREIANSRSNILIPSLSALQDLNSHNAQSCLVGLLRTNYTVLDCFLIIESRNLSLYNNDVIVLFHSLMDVITASWNRVSIIENIVDFSKDNELKAYTDSLTGLFNKQYMSELILEPTFNAINYFYVLCDLDLFKRVNDTYGHQCGDEVLKDFALRFKNSITSMNGISFRDGGEEFFALIPNKAQLIDSNYLHNELSLSNILCYLNLFRENFAKTQLQYGQYIISHTVSIGVYAPMLEQDENIEYGETSKRFAAYKRKADEALYFSKEKGRNCVTLWNSKLRL